MNPSPHSSIDASARTVIGESTERPVEPERPSEDVHRDDTVVQRRGARLDLVAGTTIGDFRVIEVIGSGGMGVVAKARDLTLDREVAIKVVAPEIAWNDAIVQRFMREARAMAAINHPGVMPILHWGRHEGLPYFVMPHHSGQTLQQWCLRSGGKDAEQLIDIARDVASALEAIHAAGMIHRDLKPSNIWLDDVTGRARVLDFGLVQENGHGDPLTQIGAMTGTPGYMAPEQVTGESVTRRTDVFSFGATFYFALSGQPPFRGPTPNAAAIATANDSGFQPLPTTKTTAGLVDLIHDCLLHDPDRRPVSAVELGDRLRPESLRSSSRWVRRRNPIRRSAFRHVVPIRTPHQRCLLALALAALNVAIVMTLAWLVADTDVRSTERDVSLSESLHPLATVTTDNPAAVMEVDQENGSDDPRSILAFVARQNPPRQAAVNHLFHSLRRRPDPRLRVDLIRMAPDMLTLEQVRRLFDRSDSADVTAALLQMLAGFERRADPQLVGPRFLAAIQRSYLEHHDPEVHASCRSLLHSWGWDDQASSWASRLKQSPAREPRDWFYPEYGPGMVRFAPPGKTALGSPEDEPGRVDDRYRDETIREVTFDYPFAISMIEITNGQMRRLMGDSLPRNFDGPEDHPAGGLGWPEAAAFCNRLSELAGIPADQHCYHIYRKNGWVLGNEFDDSLTRTGYRLPTDDEWEFACRAGTSTARHFGDSAGHIDRYAAAGAVEDSERQRTDSVAKRLPNSFGLFDMHGNISEWVHDKVWIHHVRHRRVRGGSVFTAHAGIRSAARYNVNENMMTPHRRIGFRVARTMPPIDP